MLITQRKFGIFKIVNVYFPEEPGTADIPDFDVVTYYTYKNWGDIKRFDRINYFTTTIDLSQDIGEIWSKIKRQHKRHIRRAQNDGTNITVSNNFEEFHKIYKRFLKLKNYDDPFGLNVPSSKFMQKYGILFIAKNEDKILGGNVYFLDKDNVLLVNNAYQKIGNTIENNKRSYDANCYIHWEAIQYFKNLNVINYDLGGLKSDEIKIHHKMSGLNYYKLSFGGDVFTQYEYRKFNSCFTKLLFHSWNFLRSFR